MKRTFCFAWAWLAGVLLAHPAGLIIVHESDFWRHPGPPWMPPPGPGPLPPPPHHPAPLPRIIPRPWPEIRAWAPLEVSFVKADVRVKDPIATTTIEQEFYNPNPRQLEGTFLFPVPKGAHLDKFSMEINGQQVEAELLAADKARGIYEDIVRKLRDPALLEYSGGDVFKARIFPIEPHAKKRVRLAYTQVLKADAGIASVVLPLNTEKYSAKPLKNLSVKVELETRRPLKSIYSPSHKVEITRHGGNRATLGYEASETKPDSDFQVLYSQESGDVGASVLTYKVGGEDGYFLLLASPGVDVKSAKVLPKDVAFVLDTSGSMAGAKLDQAKKALAFCIENLNDQDRFEVLRFATEVESLFDRLVDASKDHRTRAQTFVKDLKSLGGTAIDDALRKALAVRPERSDRPFVIIFLTDGRPTVGNTDENQILANVKSANQANTRVFCFGLGTDVNTHLLDKITEETKSFSQYVLLDEDLEVKLSTFFAKISDPVLTNPKLTFPDEVRVSKVYPSPLPDIFKGQQLLVAGRYTGKGSGPLSIEGGIGGESRKFSFDVQFPGEASEHEFIPRLWATRRVGYLLDEIRLRGENKELRDEVTDLARKYGIVTPYTAYLIVEDESRRGVAMERRTWSFGSAPAQDAARDLYMTMQLEKSGGQAVAGARSSLDLKTAGQASDALASVNVESFRAAPQVRSFASGSGMVNGLRAASPTVNAGAVPALQAARQVAEQVRYVHGRSFFQNGEKWVDSEVQRQTHSAQRIRVQFSSPEYFTLQEKNPSVRPWLALGRNIEFVLGPRIYEIYE